MRLGKCLFILLALCLVFSVTPARAFAGQTISQTTDQVHGKTAGKVVVKTVFEADPDVLTLAQAQEKPDKGALAQAQPEKDTLAQMEEEQDKDAPAQAQEEPEKDRRSILLHIPFVCAVMIVLLAFFIIWGKRQESKEM